MDALPWKHILADKMADGARPELHPAVEASLVYLETHGLETKGLFRVPGSASQVKVLKENFAKNKKKTFDLTDVDCHTVCSLLTDHLRNEEPILTFNLAPRWIQASGMPDLVVRLTKYVELINQLPVANHATLFALLRLLVMISQHSEKTLMPATNLGTIFGPMICRRLNSDITQELVDIPAVSKLCIDLITHFSQLFDYYDLESAGAAGFGMGMLGDGFTDSPRSKKTTRRKFQFGKEKTQGDRPTGLVFPSAAAPIQAPPTLAPELEPSAEDSSTDEEPVSGRSRATAVSFANRGKQEFEGKEGVESSKAIKPEEEHNEPDKSVRSPGPKNMDAKSVMRSLSSMGGFYAKNVGKPVVTGDDKQERPSEAEPEGAGGDDDEDDDKKGERKGKMPILNIKKRKDSGDKKKLRMFSPRKLFDKDRVKTAPDASYDSSDTDQKSYDGSSSSEREERGSEEGGKRDMKFGGRMIPFRSPRRKSSSWPEAELAEMHRKHGSDDDNNDEAEDQGEENAPPIASGSHKGRKGSKSERVASTSQAAAARKARKESASWVDGSREVSPRGKGEGGPLSEGGSAASLWAPSASQNTKSPRTPGGPLSTTPRTAATIIESLDADTNEAVASRLGYGEELGLIKWKKRVANGTARQREAAPTPTQVALTPSTSAPESIGVAFLLHRYYGDRAQQPRPTEGSKTSETSTSTTSTRSAENGRDTSSSSSPSSSVRDREGAELSEGDTTETEGTTDEEGAEEDSGIERTTRRRGSIDGSPRGRPKRKSSKTGTSGASGLKQGRKVKKGEEDEEGRTSSPRAAAAPASDVAATTPTGTAPTPSSGPVPTID